MVHLTGLSNIDCQIKNINRVHLYVGWGRGFRGGGVSGQRGRFPKHYNWWVGAILLKPAKRVNL